LQIATCSGGAVTAENNLQPEKQGFSYLSYFFIVVFEKTLYNNKVFMKRILNVF
jgi:hypothetical protein